MGVGKTTVGRKLAQSLGRSAFIDGDFVVEFHPHLDHSETNIMQMDNVLHMARNYFNFDKVDTVVLSWIMGRSTASMILPELSKIGFDARHFILTCDQKTLTQRWQSDLVNDWRTDENLQTAINVLDSNNQRTDGILLDTSELMVEEVTNQIKNWSRNAKIEKQEIKR